MLAVALAAAAPAEAQSPDADYPFRLAFGNHGIQTLSKANDAYDTDYVLEGRQLGNMTIRYRPGDGRWKELSLRELAQKGALKTVAGEGATLFGVEAEQDGLKLTTRFRRSGAQLLWEVELENTNDYALRVGDVALPMPMNHDWSWNPEITYNKRVIRHSMISDHNSFLYWMRSNAVGPYLLMTPTGDTHLEYFDQSTANPDGRPIYTVYIHSEAREPVIEKHNGSWRQPHSGVTLAAAGRKGSQWEAGFKLQWADGYESIRHKLYDEGLTNIHTVPGMTVPRGQQVKIALRNKKDIDRVAPEFPDQTALRHVRETADGYHIYEVTFNKLGENMLTVRYGDDRHFYLEYFITEPIETLLRKRSAFLVKRQQIRDPDAWYDGLFSDWSMKDEWLLTPETIRDIPEGRRYMVSSDDPALARPSFLAKKNALIPEQQEVRALDRYISDFVWGGLQMTRQEAYPYAIYGIHDWKMNRESEDPGQYGKAHIWRIYDYPHIIQMYISMYRIARYYPDIETELEAGEYLERAYGTAVAFFTVPSEVIDWSPYHTGNYNELSILDVIAELERSGQQMRANRLRQHWEKKVSNFVHGEVNLFGSEYSYDTTGFESTGAFARYAMEVAGRTAKEHDMKPLQISPDSARLFMEQQVAVNVGTRGWIEKAYYLYGSDYRGSGNAKYLLSYMAQMGGWSLLDYALYFADDPDRYLRLAYGSMLSSWALMNTGTPESNYGYWFPGSVNDGGAGGGFEPMAYATNWLGLEQGRGSWYYGCEIDLGFTGYLRGAATVVTDDPIFGLTALGGTFEAGEEELQIYPADGVRRRVHVLQNGQKVHLTLTHGRFHDEEPVRVHHNLDYITFDIDNTMRVDRQIKLQVEGLPEAGYRVTRDGQPVQDLTRDSTGTLSGWIDVSAGSRRITLQRMD